MPENGRLIELVTQMLEEQRHMKDEQKETNVRLGNLTARVERMEEHQQTTNVLLRQHSRDLSRIADLLSERVPHWGDDVTIISKKGEVSGILKKTG